MSKENRSLNAIWDLPFKAYEKLVLQYIGSQLDFKSDFLEWRKVSHAKIAEKTGMSQRTVMRVLLNLEKKGYILTCSNRKEANHYRISDKLFRRYQVWLDGLAKR